MFPHQPAKLATATGLGAFCLFPLFLWLDARLRPVDVPTIAMREQQFKFVHKLCVKELSLRLGR